LITRPSASVSHASFGSNKTRYLHAEIWLDPDSRIWIFGHEFVKESAFLEQNWIILFIFLINSFFLNPSFVRSPIPGFLSTTFLCWSHHVAFHDNVVFPFTHLPTRVFLVLNCCWLLCQNHEVESHIFETVGNPISFPRNEASPSW
jgi:hypothetical protein